MRLLALTTCVLLACGGDGEGGSGAPIAPCDVAELPSSGEGTYYDADGSGNCSFEAGGDLMVAALNTADYAGAAACGGCITVEGPDGSVTVRVVDRCPGCADGDVDLSEQAFARIAAVEDGRVPIDWRWVPCDVAGPIRYHFKEGSSAFWVGIQVRNHRQPIARVEAQKDGAWRELRREPYNYFIADGGLGPGPLALRVTDVHGQILEDTGVPLGDDTEATGSAQFESCPE